MKNSTTISWTGDMAFEAELNNHKIIIDADESVGGHDGGPRPKGLMLVALGGCTGMDVVSILAKMRVKVEGFHVNVEGELTEEHPKVYHTITIHYIFKGKDLPMDKLEKSVNLSLERYCGVTAMLNKAATVKHTITVED